MTRRPALRGGNGNVDERAALRALLRYDPRDDVPFELYTPPAPRPRTGLTITLSFLVAGTVLVTLLAVSAAQLTSRDVAVAAHERTLTALTEVDAHVAFRTADLQAQLDSGADRVSLPDFAIPDASVPRADASDGDGTLAPAGLGSALIEDGATLIYERGSAAFGDNASGDVILTTLSSALTNKRHAQALALSGGGLAVTAVLGLLLLSATGRGRWLALGLATALGGVLAIAIASLGEAFVASIDAGPVGSLRAEELAVIGALLDVPLRNGIITAGLGCVLLGAGILRGLFRRTA